jgi:hypothetical protein
MIQSIIIIFFFQFSKVEKSQNSEKMKVGKRKSVPTMLFFALFLYVKARSDFDIIEPNNCLQLELNQNVKFDCFTTGKTPFPTCCDAVQLRPSKKIITRGVGYENQYYRNDHVKPSCIMKKFYISSPQEEREIATALKILNIGSLEFSDPIDDVENKRFDMLFDYVTLPDTVANYTRLLNRVTTRIYNSAIADNADDFELLSRFRVRKECDGKITEWNEWIEPLTLSGRLEQFIIYVIKKDYLYIDNS